MRQFLDYAVPELYQVAALNDFFTVPNELFGLFLNIGEHFLNKSNRHLLVQAGSQMNLRIVGPDHDADEARELGLSTPDYQRLLYALEGIPRK